jgi:hypothetical protein
VILVGIAGNQSFCKKKVAEDQEVAGEVKKELRVTKSHRREASRQKKLVVVE